MRYRSLDLFVYGDNGNDLITVYGTPTAPVRANDHLTDGLAINPNGLRIGAGGNLRMYLYGMAGNDRIFMDYRGDLDGVLNLDARGNDGDDVVSANLTLIAGSSGQVGTASNPANVDGNFGSDNLTFMISDQSNDNGPIFAEINGGVDWWWPFENDIGVFTANVDNTGGF